MLEGMAEEHCITESPFLTSNIAKSHSSLEPSSVMYSCWCNFAPNLALFQYPNIFVLLWTTAYGKSRFCGSWVEDRFWTDFDIAMPPRSPRQTWCGDDVCSESSNGDGELNTLQLPHKAWNIISSYIMVAMWMTCPYSRLLNCYWDYHIESLKERSHSHHLEV